MSIYQRILLAVDLAPDSVLVAERARVLVATFRAQLHIIHVVEPAPLLSVSPEAAGPAMAATQVELMDAARRQIDRIAQQLDIPKANVKVVTGSTKREIIRAATEAAVDLIVIGSRERHGLAFLIRGTDEAVVHSAPCDVLAVHL
jgi:universal stress protein A